MIPNSIIVKGRRIGIIGLEAAFSNTLQKEAEAGGIDEDQAAQSIFEAIRDKNYIPSGLEDAYLDSIKREWMRFKGIETGGEDAESIEIKILGPGCVSCNRLEEMVTDVLQQESIAADIFHVREHDEIWRWGVMKTPALVINGKVMVQGKLPTQMEVRQWIKEALAG